METNWFKRLKTACENDPLQAIYTMAFATSVVLQIVSIASVVIDSRAKSNLV
jgi:cytochrome b